MRRYQPLALALVLLVTFFAGGLILSTTMVHQPLLAQGEPVQSESVKDARPVQPLDVMGNPYAIADIAEEATPGVVLISVEWPMPERAPQQNDPFSLFFDFFGPFSPSPQGPPTSSGSGFLIDGEGHIFTNQHVVGDPGQDQKVTVRLHPSSEIDLELEAEIVGADYELDLAVLKLKDVPAELQGKLPFLRMGDSDKSRPGEWMIAIGNPYGYEHTVTVGVLSAKGREIRIYDRERGRTKQYRDLLQTDAAINQGNSGGPLINIEGEVVGINTAVQATGQGIGFAIPINSALAVRDELIETGVVTREKEPTESFEWRSEIVSLTLGSDPYVPNKALMGVEIVTVSEELAQDLELSEAKGAIVSNVGSGSAAQKAGIQPYDVIVRFNDIEITTSEELVEAVSTMRPGQRVIITLLRHQVTPDSGAAA